MGKSQSDSKKKSYLVLKLKDDSTEIFQLWKGMEESINENLATFEIILQDISYDEEEHTKSCTALYGSVEEFRKAMMSTQQHVISKGIITDLVSIKDAKAKITNISMYKANKLIDKAEKSIEKLKHF